MTMIKSHRQLILRLKTAYYSRGRKFLFPFAVCTVFLSPYAANAGETAPALQFFPEIELYPHNTADPNRLRFSAHYLHFLSTGIPYSGDDRFNLSAGGRFGLVRFPSSALPDAAWQLSVEGGLDAQFDIDHDLDNIGWDGNYGLLVSNGADGGAAWKAALLHTSSHVGDEYAERTGRRRIGYTRHELALGVSLPVSGLWRAYVEGALGYDLKNDILQKPYRAECGIEYPGAVGPMARTGWYGAVDLAAWEERDWRIDLAVQTGYRVRSGSRTWRFGIEYVNGRPPMGEFFRATESYVAAGVWIDI